MKIKKMFTILCAMSLLSGTIATPAFAEEFSDISFQETQESVEPLKPTSVEMVQALDEASRMLGEGLISEQEYNSMLLDIYQINTAVRSDDEYYPEVQAGYIDYEGVVYLYEEGLDTANTAQAAIMLLMGAINANNIGSALSWGLSAVGVATSYGGKSPFEKAVNKAYFAEKGIAVYYQIHHSVQSFNKVRYVVE